MTAATLRGPSVTKIRAVPVVRRRTFELASGLDGRLRDLFDDADVVSEGGARSEDGGAVYYGSTHVLLATISAGGHLADAELAAVARIAPADPHLRVRALRIARREAIARAGAELGPLSADVRVEVMPRGIAVHVDVAAVVMSRTARTRTHK